VKQAFRGKQRTYLQYRGEDLLVVLREGPRHIFVKPSASRRPETHAGLIAAGFTPNEKPGEHDHPWYHVRFDDADTLRRAIPVLQRDAHPKGKGSKAA
jgi:hypothetical protein